MIAMLLFRARWALLGALAVGVVLAAVSLDPLTRSRAAAAALAWLAPRWLTLLPWTLCSVLFLLWRRQMRLSARWREATNYWIDLHDEATSGKVTPRRPQQQRPRSKVGAGRRV